MLLISGLKISHITLAFIRFLKRIKVHTELLSCTEVSTDVGTLEETRPVHFHEAI